MPSENDHTTESRRILARVAQEADSSGFSQMSSRARNHQQTGATGLPEAEDKIDAWATKVGRTLGLVVSLGLMIWLVLYVVGKV